MATGGGSEKQVALDYFQQLNSSLTQIDYLKYDGKFSSHMAKLEAKGLADGTDTDEQKARELADAFIALIKADGYQFVSQNLIEEEGAIPAYRFEYQNGANSAYIFISKSGGQVVSFFSSRRPGQSKLEAAELRLQAASLLETAGYDHLEIVAEKIEDDCFNITYARREGEVLCYPDKILISLAMDNGDIISLDTKEYWMNHCQRASSEAKVKIDDAESGLQQGFTVTGKQLALVCDGYGGETLCYEFRGTVGEDEYSVYINTEDGGEECICNNFRNESGFYSQ